MVISYIYNNWPNDVCVKGWASTGQFMDTKEALMRENEDLIDKVKVLEIEEINDQLKIIIIC
jgi:hypothetical protein